MTPCESGGADCDGAISKRRCGRPGCGYVAARCWSHGGASVLGLLLADHRHGGGVSRGG